MDCYKSKREELSRPSGYSQELGDLICEQIVDGYSVRKIRAKVDMPAPSSVFKWISENPQFSEHYARAKQEQAEALADGDHLD